MLPTQSARALGAGAFATLGAAMAEWMFARPRPVGLLAHLVGVDALFVIPVACALALAAPTIADVVARAREDPERRASAWLLALVPGAAAAGIVVHALSMWILGETANRTLGGLVLTLGALGAMGLGAIVAAAAARAFARLHLRLGTALGILGAIAIGLAVAGGWVLRRSLAEVDPALFRAPAGLLVGAFAGFFVVRRAAVAVLLTVGTLLAFAWPVLRLHADAPSRRAMEASCPMGAALARRESRSFDRDRDGHATRLLGGDCDDGDRSIHPGARERPGDGVDQDCSGRDLADAPRGHGRSDRATSRSSSQGTSLASLPVGLSVVLVTIDTLRWDRVGAWGYQRPTTPNLDALAARGMRFEWAYAQGPNTKSSVPSLLTGLYFSEVHRTEELWAKILPRNVFFTEILAEAGVHTAAFTAHSYLSQGNGFGQGFEHFDGSVWVGRTVFAEETAHLVVDAAVAHLQARPVGRPFFFWIHLFDAHFPYSEHEGIDFGQAESDLYDGEVAFADRHLGRLVAAVEASPHADRTAIVVHSDHGEGLGEHGYVRHGLEVFDDIMRVPMVVALPGARPGVYRSRAVSNLDLAPTILEAMGQGVPERMQGESLLPIVRGDLERGHAPVMGEMVLDRTHTPRKIWVDLPWKLHRAEWLQYELLFDVVADPRETRDLLGDRPEEARRLADALTGHLATRVREVRAVEER